MSAEEMATEEEAPTPWYDTGVVWYGKLSGGVALGGGNDGSFGSNGSRWGIKGSHALSEGLSAVYQFEAGINMADGTQSNRLAYAGLSGGFGHIKMGQIGSAVYAHSEGWRDLTAYSVAADTPSRKGSAVSYAFNSEMASFQVDAYLDGAIDTGKSVDEFQFGATINLGDIGSLGLGYQDVENTMTTGMAKPGAMTAMTSQESMEKSMTETMTGQNGDGTATEYKSNDVAILLGTSTTPHEAGTLEVVEYVYTPTTAGALPTKIELYRVPSGFTYYKETDGTVSTDPFDPDGDVAVKDYFDDSKEGATFTVEEKASEMSRTLGGDGPDHLVQKEKITIVTRTQPGEPPVVEKFYRVSAGNEYYRTANTPGVTPADGKHHRVCVTGDTSCSATTATDNVPAGFDDPGVTITRVKAESETAMTDEERAAAEEAAKKAAEEAAKKAAEEAAAKSGVKYGHTATHVTLQMGLGAITGTLGYSQIDSNDPAKTKDKKVSVFGLSGGLGDSGMSWAAFSKNVKDHDGTDSNPWGVSLTQSLGDNVAAYVDHGNADDGESGTTFLGLSVSF